MTWQNPMDVDVRRALEENLWALWSRFGRGDGCVLYEEAHALWFDTPLAQLPYNAVLRFSGERNIDGDIDALFEHYRRRGVPFLWMVHPSARPGDLGDRLRARGMDEVEACPGMFVWLDELPPREPAPDGIEIAEVTHATDVARVLELVAWRWEVPADVVPSLPAVTRAFEIGAPGSAVRAWLACRQGVPVAKALLNLAAGVAGLYGVATRPEARGNGLARLLTLEAFAAARRAGYDIGILHSTPMARRMYEKIGLRTLAVFRMFAPPGALHL